ncbi:MAG: hemolysin family protein [Kineosporiaceae bacterium]
MVGDVTLVLFLVLLGGVFAGAEIALVNLRPAQAATIGERGAPGRAAATLLADENRFLAAVQIGVTLLGFLSSAFGASRFADNVAPLLVAAGLSEGVAGILAVVAITIVIAYLSLVLGELVPKRLALRSSERFALATAPLLLLVARIARPFIWFLGVSSNAVLLVLGAGRARDDGDADEEELRHAVATTGALTPDERRLLTDVLESGDRPMREIMTPRLDVDVLPADLSVGVAMAEVRDRPHSRYPVTRTSLDDTVGFIHVRDLMGRDADDPTTLEQLARPLLEVPESRPLLPTLAEMRRNGVHIALVVDEYGGGAGIVTLEDLIEELVGDISDEFDPAEEHEPARRPGGDDPSELGTPLPEEPVDAQLRLAEFEELTGLDLPEGPYDTAAGWILRQLGRIPAVGDSTRHGDVEVVVTAMRGNRIEEVRLERAPSDPAPPD